MSTLETIRAELAPDIDRLNERISQHLATSNPLLQTIITRSLRSKGKLIRPIMVFLSARVLGGVNDKVISAAAALELLHNASLIHDDVVDHSMERRNIPTINAVWDNHVAVLVGDYFVSSALQLAISTGCLEIVESVCSLGHDLSLGELDQIYTAMHHEQTEETYMRVISYKTATLFRACAYSAACALGVTDSRVKVLVSFAELLGQCFQMRDDVFDYFDDPAVGKPTGNDLREGKVTLPLIHALQTARGPERDAMMELVRKEVLSDAEIDVLTRFAIDNGGIAYTYRRMEQLRDRGAECLAALPDSPARTMLADLFDYIIRRNF